jgi:hypothetical protein
VLKVSLSSGAATDVVVFIHLSVDVLRECHYVTRQWRGQSVSVSLVRVYESMGCLAKRL